MSVQTSLEDKLDGKTSHEFLPVVRIRLIEAIMRYLLIIMTLLTLSAGCGTDAERRTDTERLIDLKAIYEAYSRQVVATGKPPANLDDLLTSIKATGDSPLLQLSDSATALVKNGDLIIRWSVDLKSAAAQTEVIMAYEKVATEKGGYVCYVDGRVKSITKEEFQSAELAYGNADEWKGSLVQNDAVMVGNESINMLHRVGPPVPSGISNRQPTDADHDTKAGQVQRDVREFYRALIEGNVDALVRLLSPRIMEEISDSEMRMALIGQVQQRRVLGMVEISLTFPASPTFVESNAQEFAIVPYLLVTRVGAARIKSAGYKIGIRPIGGAEWTYVDGAELEKAKALSKMLPDLPEGITFPEAYTKKMQSAE